MNSALEGLLIKLICINWLFLIKQVYKQLTSFRLLCISLRALLEIVHGLDKVQLSPIPMKTPLMVLIDRYILMSFYIDN